MIAKMQCSFPNCEKPYYKTGLCRGHFEQKWKGKELKPLKDRRTGGSLPEITIKKVPCTVPGLKGMCHEWTGYIRPDGYGSLSYKGKPTRVHCYVWEVKHGPIPKGLVIDHQCRNPACCNLKHLRLVTRQVNSTENVQGATWQKNASKTHCKRGHKFTEKNTYITPAGSRRCQKCKRIHNRRYTQRVNA